VTEHDLIDLLNREIDGTLLPAEAAVLSESLSRDPLAQQLRSDLRAATQALNSLKLVEPPHTLKPGVFQMIQEQAQAERRPSRKSSFLPILEFLRGRAKPGYAYAFSGGLAAGALLFALFLNVFSGSSFDESGASATLAMSGEKLSLSLDQVHGYIIAEHSENSNSLTLRLNSERDITVRIAYDPNSVRFEGAQILENPDMQLSAHRGEVEIAGSGPMGYKIAFGGSVRTAPEVQIRVFSSGQLIYDHSIRMNQGPR